MSQTPNIVRGTLLPDGTLELAERPSLPAGPVEVTIRPFSTPARTSVSGENWWECLQRLRAEREASGVPFRTREEIDIEIEEMRSGGVDRIDEIWLQIEASRARDGSGR